MKKNENGRSMVEMLGVLAIIGVLSVAGIKGYTIAMRKYYANEIAHVISMMATTMKTANGGDGIDASDPSTHKDYQSLLDVNTDLSGVLTLKATSDTTIFLETNDEDLCNAVELLFGHNDSNPIYVKTTGTDSNCANEELTLTVK